MSATTNYAYIVSTLIAALAGAGWGRALYPDPIGWFAGASISYSFAVGLLIPPRSRGSFFFAGVLIVWFLSLGRGIWVAFRAFSMEPMEPTVYLTAALLALNVAAGIAGCLLREAHRPRERRARLRRMRRITVQC